MAVELNTYRYKAINKRGRTVYGVLSASDENHLAKRLADVGIELIRASQMKPRSTWLFSPQKRKVPIRDLLQFFIQLEQMQASGVMLLEALAHSRAAISNKNFVNVVDEMHRLVSEGASMSEAMSQFPHIFKKLYVAIVKASEQTGDMVGAYRYLIQYLKWVDDMNRRVRKATRYPIILTIAIIITVVVMMGFVVPQIIDFLTAMDSKEELPFLTRALVATSSFFQNYWYVLLIGIVLVAGGVSAMRKLSDRFRFTTDAMILKIPVIGELVRKIDVAQFAYTVSALFTAGIPLLQCLKTAQVTVGNMAMEKTLVDVHDEMARGATLSDALHASGEYPVMVVQMVRIAEESGKMADVLDQIAEFYNNDVDETVQGVISMIEPMMTAILGGMILWIAVAVFGPIYGMFENMQF